MGWQDAPARDNTWQSAPEHPFEAQLQGMTPDEIYVAQRQNTPMGEYLRAKAMQPRDGETADQRFTRLYGGSKQEPMGAGEGMARAGYQGLSFGAGDEATAALAATLNPSGPGDWNQRYTDYLMNERGKLEQFRREQPVLAGASEIAGAIPTALAIPMMGGANLPLATRAAIGALQGGVEAGAYGFNAGEGSANDRMGNAAITGGVGAGVGMLAPAAAAGIGNLINRGLWNTAAKQAGMDPAAYRVLTQTVDADRINPATIGPDTALADVAPRGMKILDTAAQTTGPQARMVEDAVTGRVNNATQRINQAMDTTLGQPQGVTATTTALRQGTAGARSAAYDAAYGMPIDYTTDAGRQIETLVRDRVPMTAINKANAMMRAEGNRSMQIKANIGPDGAVTFETLPDVRQIDYITRALNDVAQRENGAGALGGQTQMGRLYQGLSRELRDLTRQAVPEYATALDTAAAPIQARNAMLAGQAALSARVTRDEFAEQIAGMSRAELDFVRQGVRAQIDDTLANVKTAFTDPNLDAKEAAKALKDLTTRAARDKMQMLLGPQEAAQFYREIDATFPAFSMKAAIAQNSKTAPREILNEAIKAQTDDGIVNAIRSGKPVDATQRLTQALLGRTANDKARITDETYQQLVGALLKQGDDARRLVAMMNLSAQNIPPRMDQMGRLTQLLLKGTATGTTAPMVQR